MDLGEEVVDLLGVHFESLNSFALGHGVEIDFKHSNLSKQVQKQRLAIMVQSWRVTSWWRGDVQILNPGILSQSKSRRSIRDGIRATSSATLDTQEKSLALLRCDGGVTCD